MIEDTRCRQSLIEAIAAKGVHHNRFPADPELLEDREQQGRLRLAVAEAAHPSFIGGRWHEIAAVETDVDVANPVLDQLQRGCEPFIGIRVRRRDARDLLPDRRLRCEH